jgi:uncharacterized membrane protein YqhA
MFTTSYEKGFMYPMKMMKQLERLFESLLWSSRLTVIVAVLASLLTALIMFYVATADCVMLLREAVHYGPGVMGSKAQQDLHSAILTTIAEIIDGYLFATILIIFSLGLYELFISKIDPAENSKISSSILSIHTIDDLKDRLAKVIFLVLIVRYFEWALQFSITSSLDLLYLAIGLALVALALYLTGKHSA